MIENNKRMKEDLIKLIGSVNGKSKKLNFSILADIYYTNQKDFDEYAISLSDVTNFVESEGVSVYFDDVEDEPENLNEIEEIHTLKNKDSQYKLNPFDPSKVDISMKQLTFDLLIKRLDNDEIDLSPNFQRKSGLWTQEQKSRLIESLLLRIPLPAFYFDGTNNSNWIIIDGLQRLTAIKEFFVTKTLRLQGLEFLKDFKDFGVDDLTRTHSRRIEETQVVAYVINPGTPDNLKFNIFKRINTGGLKLEPQEIRHALYQGQATDFLKTLANSQQFKLATCGSVKTDRMMDREFVLRFVSYYLLGEDKYRGSIDDFLIDGMKLLNKLPKETLYDLEYKFYHAMKLAYTIFGSYAFRKQFDKTRRNQINKGLFEAWSVELAKLTEHQFTVCTAKAQLIDEAFMAKLNIDDTFVGSLNGNFEGFVKYRFKCVRELIGDILND
jgi:hypothetical protein